MKIILNGARGAMGKNVAELASRGVCGAVIAAAVSRSYETDPNLNQYSVLNDYAGDADVVIDFSNHAAVYDLLDYCLGRLLPVVICTTGHTDEEKALIYKAAESIPVFYSFNMSVGVAVLSDITKKVVEAFPDADIEVVEIHHNRKLDVPSGTAIILGNAIKEARESAVFNIGRHENGKRSKEEIGFHSLRLGNVVGTHEIIVTTGMETITLKHEAHSRALFAEGALRAAAYLVNKPAGYYDMKQMLND